LRTSLQSALLLALFATTVCGRGQTAKLPASVDTDLLEATIPQIEAFYKSHRYTVTQVTRWYLARIHRYNGIYGDIETLDEQGGTCCGGMVFLWLVCGVMRGERGHLAVIFWGRKM
jgi:hypothetical protein